MAFASVMNRAPSLRTSSHSPHNSSRSRGRQPRTPPRAPSPPLEPEPEPPSHTHPQHTSDHRQALLSEYLTHEAVLASNSSALDNPPIPPPDIASRIAARITLARDMQLAETPSEASLVDRALEHCTRPPMSPRASRADVARRNQRHILAELYPTHPSLHPFLSPLRHSRHRASVLRNALRDHALALTKLTDAANLLMLISEHVHTITSGYSPSFSSSSSDFSSDEDARPGCLARAEDGARTHMYLTNVPSNYRVRYLRKCWGYAADALASAVDLSCYLEKQLEKDGNTELIPGVFERSKPSFSMLELPGGLTLMLKPDMLRKMAQDAKVMRESVSSWQNRQRKFMIKLRKDLGKVKKTVAQYEACLVEARRHLLAEEFPEVASAPS